MLYNLHQLSIKSMTSSTDVTILTRPHYSVIRYTTIYRYRDYRDEEGNRTMFYWKLLCARLLFVILFEVCPAISTL